MCPLYDKLRNDFSEKEGGIGTTMPPLAVRFRSSRTERQLLESALSRVVAEEGNVTAAYRAETLRHAAGLADRLRCHF